jgi:dienelactone hydrolase
MVKFLQLSICFLSALCLSACAMMFSATAPDELARTWDGAIVAIPQKYFLDVSQVKRDKVAFRGRMKDVAHHLTKIMTEIQIPLVIYLHGCGGFGYSGSADISFLVSNGYAVLAPDSFSREYKPKSCEPSTYLGGLHREVLSFRLAEAEYAHDKAKTLPWVDKRNIFMMGYSEGGITTAQYDRGGLAGRIILGWTCNHPWPGYSGISGPRDEPILAAVASRDPWFINHPSSRGDCGAYAFRRKIESIIRDADVHYVQGSPDIRKKFFNFLKTTDVTNGIRMAKYSVAKLFVSQQFH